MFDFSSFICMVRIRTFWVVWIEDLGPTVALSFFDIARVAQDLVTLYMTFCWDIDPPYIFCGYDRLLSMDPPCSFVAMTPLDLIWRLFSYWVTMIVSSVIHMLDPPVSLWRWFVYGPVCTTDQFCLTFISLSGTSYRAYDLGLSVSLTPYSVVSIL